MAGPDRIRFQLKPAVTSGVLAIFLAAGAQGTPTPPLETHPPGPRFVLPSPLQPLPTGHIPGLTLALDLDHNLYGRLHGLTEGDRVVIPAFVLGPHRAVDLDLERFEVLAPDATLVVSDGAAEEPMARPDVVLLRGTVAGAPSSVFLALSPHGSQGFIRIQDAGHADTKYIISTPPQAGGLAAGAPTVIYQSTSLPDGVIDWLPFRCGVADLPRQVRRETGGGSPEGPLPCRRLRIAIETDWEYTSVFGGESAAAQAYISTLMGAASYIFERDANIRLDVGYTRVWSGPNDPYTAPIIELRLTEFQSHWNQQMHSVNRNVAHMLSGLRSGAGGIAWVGAACGSTTSYGLSGYMNGAFPYPLVNNHQQNWDVMVVTHEIAHNLDAVHTHEMTPPVDQCGLGICSGAHHGTIMSYCHTCSGGMSNIRLDLHQRVVNENIDPYLHTISCSVALAPVEITQQPAPRTAIEGQSIQFTVEATGTGPRIYQWLHNDQELTSGITISGVNSPTLTIHSVTERLAGEYRVRISNTCGEILSEPASLTVLPPCYANCDQSTTQPVLSVDDFTCFINEFSHAQALPLAQQITHYANCDESTHAPILTVDDFVCFINLFAAGCP